MSISYKMSDGNATEYHDTLTEAASSAEDWYQHMLDADDVSEDLRSVIYGADFDGVESVEDLNSMIGCLEEKIAAALGKTSFSGHGTYHVSAADQAGLRLSCSVTVKCDSR
jgi:preprotein translocase subunit SecA